MSKYLEDLDENWGFYDDVNPLGQPVAAVVNLTYQFAKKSDVRRCRPWLAVVVAKHPGRRLIGRVDEIQRALCERVNACANTEFVARRDGPDETEFWFYSDSDHEPSENRLALLGESMTMNIQIRQDASPASADWIRRRAWPDRCIGMRRVIAPLV